jgi:hypothetical protein
VAGLPVERKEVIAMTAARRPRRGQVMTLPTRALRTLRYVNDELTRASEAIIRSARAPQQPPLRDQAPVTGATFGSSAAERAGKAA